MTKQAHGAYHEIERGRKPFIFRCMTGHKRKERGRISEDSTNISCKEKKRNREMHIICARFPNEAV